MERIGACEAKTHLPKILERVAKGEHITITKHGLPIAVLQPPAYERKPSPKEAIKELHKFRIRHRLKGISILDMIEEGRH
jgi:prevent-host-death family protein